MAHNDKILRDAAFGADFSPIGIASTSIQKSDSYYRDPNQPELTPDPLAKNAKAANKPGSSIPSIFGRMIFFKTALRNASINGGTNSIYDKTTSQWLDLLEGIFTHSYNYQFLPWNKEDQLKRLKKNHKVLHDALENQFNKYFDKSVDTIFIIKDKEGEIIGGTSPYTLVFTSPKHSRTANRPICPLKARDEKFRIFLYHIYTALSHNNDIPVTVSVANASRTQFSNEPNPIYQMIDGLLAYLKRNLESEDQRIQNEVANAHIDTVPKLIAKYEQVTYPVGNLTSPVNLINLNSVSESANGNIYHNAGTLSLLSRKAGAVTSDFFIDADRTGITGDTGKLPIILPNEDMNEGGISPYAVMEYVDNHLWHHGLLHHPEVYNIENAGEADMDLPQGYGIRHNWLSAASFFEEKLIKLPYKMDEDHFMSVINIEQDSLLIPLRPKAFKYLKEDTVLNGKHGQGNGFKWQHDEQNNQLICTLDVPVRNNDGTKKGFVRLKRSFSLTNDVVVAGSEGNQLYPVSIGISPFIRLPKPIDNRYDIVLHHCNVQSPVSGIYLSFYDAAVDGPLQEVKPNFEGDTVAADANVNQRLYKMRGRDFDICRLNYDMVNSDPVGGLVIINWDKPQDGAEEIFYAIDFGTTNTHIACITQGVDAVSFSADELKSQAVYLAKKENIKDEATYLQDHTTDDVYIACDFIYGDLSAATQNEQARRFFPNFELDQFSFPLRTAAYEPVKVGNDIFDGFSIGFNYPQEQEQKHLRLYRTSIKWDLEQKNVGSDHRAELFFQELLLVVRNHWLHTPGADRTKFPHIALTTPLALQANNIFGLWAKAYALTFGVSENDAKNVYLHEISESLAPAHLMISSGQYTVNGLLNVDIGGGTTDLQYYREKGGKPIAVYNSEKFAGDDLWGCGRENMGVATNITENLFTRYADDVMKNHSITIGTATTDYTRLKELHGKEKIGRLLRDRNNQFANAISNHTQLGRNTPALKVVFLHYSAIIYHVAKWVLSNERMAEKFPEVINFTGFGSKYITILFGDNEQGRSDLTAFTRALLKEYGVSDTENIHLTFSANPKHVTAEGAAIYAKNRSQGGTVTTPSKGYYPGYPGCDPRKSPTFGEANKLTDEVMTAVDEYIEGFNKVQENANLDIPSLTEDEIKGLKSQARNCYNQIVNNFLQGDGSRENSKALQSLFFWSLKDAFFNFDKY